MFLSAFTFEKNAHKKTVHRPFMGSEAIATICNYDIIHTVPR